MKKLSFLWKVWRRTLSIALHHRELYEVEQQTKNFIGALTFTEREEKLIAKHHKTSPADMEEFKENYIEPFLQSFGSCMCAYVAYYWPEYADKLLKRLQ